MAKIKTKHLLRITEPTDIDMPAVERFGHDKIKHIYTPKEYRERVIKKGLQYDTAK